MAPISSNDGGPPTPRRRRGSLSDDEHPLEDPEASEEEEENDELFTESEDEDLVIPPDPDHELRMALLRSENSRLQEIVRQQDIVLAEMAERTEEIRQATAQRQQELDMLRAARLERERKEKEEKDKEAEEKKKKKKVVTFQRKRRGTMAKTVRAQAPYQFRCLRKRSVVIHLESSLFSCFLAYSAKRHFLITSATNLIIYEINAQEPVIAGPENAQKSTKRSLCGWSRDLPSGPIRAFGLL